MDGNCRISNLVLLVINPSHVTKGLGSSMQHVTLCTLLLVLCSTAAVVVQYAAQLINSYVLTILFPTVHAAFWLHQAQKHHGQRG